MKTDHFDKYLKETLNRLELNRKQGADYLGVSVFTLRKWINGERKPNSAVLRLVSLLNSIEHNVPEFHRLIISKCKYLK